MNKRNAKGQFNKGTHWREKSDLWDKEWLYNEYINKEKSTGDISKSLGLTDAAVLYWMKKHGIPRRTISESRDKVLGSFWR